MRTTGAEIVAAYERAFKAAGGDPDTCSDAEKARMRVALITMKATAALERLDA
jgi:hypothetical protein